MERGTVCRRADQHLSVDKKTHIVLFSCAAAVLLAANCAVASPPTPPLPNLLEQVGWRAQNEPFDGLGAVRDDSGWLAQLDSDDAHTTRRMFDRSLLQSGSCQPSVTPQVGICSSLLGASLFGTPGTDAAYAAAVTSDGGLVVVGSAASGASGGDIVVIRLANDSSVLWTRTWGGTADDEARGVALASNGDIVVAGYTYSFGSGQSDSNAVVMRLSSDGTLQWVKTSGGAYNDGASAVLIGASDGVVVVGYEGTSSGTAHVMLFRLDVSGNVVWSSQWGGTISDPANGATVLPGGDIVVVGNTYSFGAAGFDVFVLRVTYSSGSVVWSKRWGGSNDDQAYGVAVSPSGAINVALSSSRCVALLSLAVAAASVTKHLLFPGPGRVN